MRPVLTQTVAPASVVTLAALKARLRVNHSEDDSLLSAMLAAAVEFLDGPTGYLGRCIGTQTWTQKFESFPAGDLRLDVTPVQSIASVKYFNAANVETTMSASDYELIATNEDSVLHAFDAWPGDLDARRRYPVTVTAVCGFASVPESIKEAICQHVAIMYEVQAPLGNVGQVIPLTYDDLISRYKRASL